MGQLQNAQNHELERSRLVVMLKTKYFCHIYYDGNQLRYVAQKRMQLSSESKSGKFKSKHRRQSTSTMGDESSSDDLLIDVDEEDFALTAEELEKAEELLEVKPEAKGVKARQGVSNDLKLMEEKLDSKLETVNGAAPEAVIEARRNCEVTSDLASLLHSTPGPLALTSPTAPLYGGKSFSSEPSVKEKPNVDRGVVQANGLNHPMIMGSGGFTVKKVSRPGQQSFIFGKPSSQAAIPANQNVASGMFTFGHSAGSTITSAPTAGSMERSRDPRRGKLQGVAVQPRQIRGLSSTPASTSAFSPQVPRLSPAQHQGNDSKISGGKALQRMGPSALERMAAEQERKCREENAKKEQLEKMVALKKAKVAGGHLQYQVRAQPSSPLIFFPPT